MKKFLRLAFCLGFVLLFVPFVGCGQVGLNDYSKEYISEYRQNLFVGKTGFFTATFTSGERESDYKMDGVKTDLVDFGVLTIKFNSAFGEDLPKFKLSLGDKCFEGELEKNPFDGSFVFDAEMKISNEENVLLELTDFDEKLKLVCVSDEWVTSWQDAVEIFNQKFTNEIASHTDKGKFQGEIFVKIVSTSKTNDNIYWYVLGVCDNGDIYACLIDPNTKEILQV